MIESGNEIVIVTEIVIERARGAVGWFEIRQLDCVAVCDHIVYSAYQYKLSLANSLFSLLACISVYWS